MRAGAHSSRREGARTPQTSTTFSSDPITEREARMASESAVAVGPPAGLATIETPAPVGSPYAAAGDESPSDRKLFVLALCDERGAALRAATAGELAALNDSSPLAPESAGPTPREERRHMTLQEILAAKAAEGGPVCCHCGVTGACRRGRRSRANPRPF